MKNPRLNRRQIIQMGAGLAAGAAFGRFAVAQKLPKLRIAHGKNTAALPLYVAVERGFFKEAGVEVEVIGFDSGTQVVEGLISGRLDGCATGMAIGVLALGDIAQPGLYKVFSSNVSRQGIQFDTIIVAKDSPIQKLSDLKGKKFGCGPGAQNQTVSRRMLEKAGVTDAQIVELNPTQFAQALSVGQLDAAYAIEPVATVGAQAGLTRTLEHGVISRYVLGDENQPWLGGGAVLSTQYLKGGFNTSNARFYVLAYKRAVQWIRKNPQEARKYLAGYTAVAGDLAKSIPLPGWLMWDEYKPSDLSSLQEFLDLFYDKKVFEKRVVVDSIIYKG